MRKYENPKIEVKNFHSETILTDSALTQAMQDWQTKNPKAKVTTVDWAQGMQFTF